MGGTMLDSKNSDGNPKADDRLGIGRASHDPFTQSFSNLSRFLVGGQVSSESNVELETFRLAGLATDLPHTSRLLPWALGGVGVSMAGAGIAWMVALIGVSATPDISVVQTQTESTEVNQAPAVSTANPSVLRIPRPAQSSHNLAEASAATAPIAQSPILERPIGKPDTSAHQLSTNPQAVEAQPQAVQQEAAQRQMAEEKARANAARDKAEAEARAAAQEAAQRQMAEAKARADAARDKAEAEARVAAQEAAQRQMAEDKVRADAARDKAEADARAAAQEAAQSQMAEDKARADAARDKAEAEARAAAQEAAQRQLAEDKARADAAPTPASSNTTAKVDDMEQPGPSLQRDSDIRPASTIARTKPIDALSEEVFAATVAPKQSAPQRTDVREIQVLLQGFGFDPGPIDGVAGPKTQTAALHYLQSRSGGGADSSIVDNHLLEVLRRDPVPALPPWPTPAAQRQKLLPRVGSTNPQVAQHQAAAPSNVSPNPVLISIKTASDRLGRWLNSIGH
jgi:hypothetical protein